MKLIPIHPLECGLFAKVDDVDYERLCQHKWYARKSERTFYAYRFEKGLDGCNHIFLMHRTILDLQNDRRRQGFVRTDHKNHDGLDNQRENLRIATSVDSSRNRRAHGGKKFKGVYAHPHRGLWRAQITILKKRVHLGLFMTQEQAARAYDHAARKHFAEFAQCNFPEESRT